MTSVRFLILGVLSTVTALGCGGTPAGDDIPVRSAAMTSGDVDLIAIGTLGAGTDDRARPTTASGVLENGASSRLLGGLGSGLAYAGDDTFLGLPDRGPNAVPYNAAVDETTSYVPRVHTLRLRLRPAIAGAPLPYDLSASLEDTTLLFSRAPLFYSTGTAAGLPAGAPTINSRHAHYFSGRSDNFDPTRLSTDEFNGRLDPESVRVSNDGRSLYITDEYGPYVYEFDRASGQRRRAYALPDTFAVANVSAQGALEISGNISGRVANKGMEGLAITPDGDALIGAMQSPLLQDGGTDGRFSRIVVIPLRGGVSRQYAYPLTNIGTAAKPKYPTISDIVAINDHQFLVDERDGKGLGDNSTAAFKKIYRIDLTAAADVSAISGDANLAAAALSKELLIDVVAVLNAHGIASIDIPAKLEGLAFGPDVRVDGQTAHTLFVANDNDFLSTVVDSNHPAGIDNPNRFFVFAVPAATLPAFQPQRFCGGRDRR